MKKIWVISTLILVACLISFNADAQCAMCTKTASQLGEKPALGLNRGILYLMITPFAIIGFIGYRWWKSNKSMENNDAA